MAIPLRMWGVCVTHIPAHIAVMQDLAAEARHWRQLAKERGPGWRAWRWEDVEDNRIVWKYRLLAPGEDGEGEGVVLRP